jgi:hypothetical protein
MREREGRTTLEILGLPKQTIPQRQTRHTILELGDYHTGCDRSAVQDHYAAVRYEASGVCNVASLFASGLRPVTLIRMVAKVPVEIFKLIAQD